LPEENSRCLKRDFYPSKNVSFDLVVLLIDIDSRLYYYLIKPVKNNFNQPDWVKRPAFCSSAIQDWGGRL